MLGPILSIEKEEPEMGSDFVLNQSTRVFSAQSLAS